MTRSFESCKTCGKYDWTNRHVCPPAWELWIPEDGEERAEARTVYGSDAEDAVEKWAERSDPDRDYSIVSGSETTVHIALRGEPDFVKVVVTGESVPSYTAREVS